MMPYLVLSLAALAAMGSAFAQNASSTTSFYADINGNRTAATTIEATGNSRVERTQTINGRTVPREQIEDKVVRDDASGKVVERTIRRFDTSGNPLPIDRVTIAETKLGDGSTVTDTTVRRGDVNGNLVLSERTRAETRKNGASTISDIVVERASLNGSLEVNERQSVAAVEQGSTIQQTATVFLRDANGSFYEARRDVKETTKTGMATTENVASYEPGPTGKLTLARQEARSTVKNPDGGVRSEVTVFESLDGQILAPGAAPQLREQFLIEKRPTADGAIEIVRVRQSSPDNPNRLGPATVVSEAVCKGKCLDK